MTFHRVASVTLLALAIVVATTVDLHVPAQQAPPVTPSLFAEMRWRNIGPLRAGRTKAAAGHPSQPFTFYIGMCNGGVWKTTDAGRTWKPIFDDQPTGSIGWIAVAPSDPNIIYVGSGEGLPRPDLSIGDGIYKSTDAGKTWTHLGLRDAQQIPKIAIDPKNPNRLFVAALGHPYGPNEERGIFRSTDGGQTFQRVLFKDENTGGKDVDIDPVEPRHRLRDDVGTAAGAVGERRVERHQRRHLQVDRRRHDVEAADAGAAGRASSTRRSAIAPSNPRRVYATVEAACRWRHRHLSIRRRRRDVDAQHDRHASDQPHQRSRCRTCIPKDPDTLIVTDIVSYKSTDGGKTFVPFKGAPGGDDNQNIWWNPNNPNIMLLVVDQGAVVTLNGGQTLELVVHAADRGALSRDDRQRVSRTACAAGSRTADRCASRAAATTARSRSATGIRSASRSTATPRPIRSIPTSSTAAR